MPHAVLKDYPHHLTKYDSKILIFKLFNELGKIWKCDLGFSKIQIFLSLMNQEKLGSIHCPRPTFQNPNFKSMDELGKVMS